MLGNMVAYNTIKAEDLLVEMAADTPPFILDVRSVEEVTEQGHIEGAAHIPLNELAQHINLSACFRYPDRGLLWQRLARHHCHDSPARYGLDKRPCSENYLR